MKSFFKKLFGDTPTAVENKNKLVKTTPGKAAGIAGTTTAILQGSEATAEATGGVVGEAIADNLSGCTISTIIPAAIGTSALGGPVAPILIGISASVFMAAGIAGVARYALNECGLKLLNDAEAAVKLADARAEKAEALVKILEEREQRLFTPLWQSVDKNDKNDPSHILAQAMMRLAPEELLPTLKTI